MLSITMTYTQCQPEALIQFHPVPMRNRRMPREVLYSQSHTFTNANTEIKKNTLSSRRTKWETMQHKHCLVCKVYQKHWHNPTECKPRNRNEPPVQAYLFVYWVCLFAPVFKRPQYTTEGSLPDTPHPRTRSRDSEAHDFIPPREVGPRGLPQRQSFEVDEKRWRDREQGMEGEACVWG